MTTNISSNLAVFVSRTKEKSYLALLRIAKLVPRNSLITKIFFKFNVIVMKSIKPSRAKYLIQQVIDALFCKPEVLAGNDLPPISIAICCTNKDIKVLGQTIEGLIKFSLNPIRRISLISPTPIKLPNGLNLQNVPVEYINDSELIGSTLEKIIKDVSPKGREGWITQQILKFQFAINSSDPYVLIIDSDTILLTPHAFVDKRGIQILSISYETHSEYSSHASRFLNTPEDPISYVTHYQLWQKRVINELFPNGDRDLNRWIDLGNFTDASAVSEFHTYGSCLRYKHPDLMQIVSWANLSVPYQDVSKSKDLIERIVSQYGTINSISMHSYLN